MFSLDRELFRFFVFIVSVVSPISVSGSDIGRLVECSACYSLPVRNVDSYTCKVRCDISDDSKTNVTGMHDVLNQVIQELKDTKEKLEDTKTRLELLEQKVSFTARLVTLLETQSGDVIKFSAVLHNARSGYSASTGIFTAPSNGTYEFTVITANELENDQMRTDLMRGDEMLFRVRSEGENHSNAVGTIIVNLVEVEEIFAKAYDSATYAGKFNIFSGNKI